MKKTNNILYAVFSLLTTFSFYKYTNYFINYYSLNIYLRFLIIPLYLLLFFLFYKKLYKDISLEKKYNIFVLILSFLETLGYSYLVKSNSSLLYHGLNNIINSIFIFGGFYYFLKTCIYVVVKILEKEYTKEYNDYINLSEEEKENAIVPRKYNISGKESTNEAILQNENVPFGKLITLAQASAYSNEKTFSLKNYIPNKYLYYLLLKFFHLMIKKHLYQSLFLNN